MSLKKHKISIQTQGDNFTLTSEKIHVRDISEFRKDIDKYFEGIGGMTKQKRDVQSEYHGWPGYWNIFVFKDIYFAKGNLFTVSGESSRISECYCNPSDYFEEKKIGRKARENDPGDIEMIIEGYIHNKNSLTFENLTGLPRIQTVELNVINK